MSDGHHEKHRQQHGGVHEQSSVHSTGSAKLDAEREKKLQLRNEQKEMARKQMAKEKEHQMLHAIAEDFSWGLKTCQHLLKHYQGNLKVEAEAEAGRILQHTLLYDSDEEAEQDPDSLDAVGTPSKEESFDDFRAYAHGVHTLENFGSSEHKLQFLFYAYAQDHENLISRDQVEHMITSHCEPRQEEDKQDRNHYKTKLYTWAKGRYKKYAKQKDPMGGKETFMTYEDCFEFMNTHPTAMADLTINVKEYTDHTREVEHKRKVASILLGRSRSGSDEAIKLHPAT